MTEYIKHHAWRIIEEGFHPENNKVSESIFSIGNGAMGQRANFEEEYSGNTLQGSYIGGVYYPDKTRVGWWKNGYPEYFAKIINATNWIGVKVRVQDEVFDLNTCQINHFKRELNMQEGTLTRTVTATLPSGKQLTLKAQRFVSLQDTTLGAVSYAVTPLNFNGEITLLPLLDGGVKNADANYNEQFWQTIAKQATTEVSYLHTQTKKTHFDVAVAMRNQLFIENQQVANTPICWEKDEQIGQQFSVLVRQNQTLTLHKYVAVASSFSHPNQPLVPFVQQKVSTFESQGYKKLLKEHTQAWQQKWNESDIKIEGDIAAQQAIRYNIFQLYQTYTGANEQLNIGPKGFTGEKYGGVTYWDTEAYCLPFYMRTSEAHVARNLLKYRYNHLKKAQENAEKLGFNRGAALYPMVTINGEECHNEWEITFEEIHRNGAIAYAIYNYIQYTGDTDYMLDYGLEVLIAISRFWAQRVNWSQAKQKYVLLGVTGPNEYENNVNNNWYTLKLIEWTLRYTLEQLELYKDLKIFDKLCKKTAFNTKKEADKWMHILDNLYLPEDQQKGIFLQQDGFLDKELVPANQLPANERPIHEHWSWDRILRSCYIKQADVLQGLYMFQDEYPPETIKRNFEFYEPLTVHESSLSPCIHSILASAIGLHDKAYEMYLRTARLDLDNLNNDTADGLHITSMGGTWMTIVEGFAGLRISQNMLSFTPNIPAKWKSYNFTIRFRSHILEVTITQTAICIKTNNPQELVLLINGQTEKIDKNNPVEVQLSKQQTVS